MKNFNNPAMWKRFINDCRGLGVDLDFIIYALYEFCIERDLEDWKFTEEERELFIDNLCELRRDCEGYIQ